jgi:hypothetical protein
MRTLVATVLYNGKGKKIYCTAKKVTDQHVQKLRKIERQILEEAGFDFIKFLSLEYPDVKGHAIFFEGHIDDMTRTLNSLDKNYPID